MLHWVLFVILSVVGYVCISIFGRMVGSDSGSFVNAFLNTFKPLPFLIMVLGNAVLGGALYYGFLSTAFAITVAIAIGVMTSFFYSSIVFGLSITLTKVVGLVFIILGIYLLK